MVQGPVSVFREEALEVADPDWDILDEEWLSDEPELETDFHREQIDLLLRLLKGYWRDRSDAYCSGNTTVYYDESQRTNRNFRGPDVYVVLGVDPRPRNSWMTWREGGRYPNVVIELLSNATAQVDRTTKKELYQDVWRVPNYFWFHPRTRELKGFRLVDRRYEEIVVNEAGWLWSDELGLFLGLYGQMLRLFTAQGELVLLREEEEEIRAMAAEERAMTAEERAMTAEERAMTAEERLEQLAARLRELGVDLDL